MFRSISALHSESDALLEAAGETKDGSLFYLRKRVAANNGLLSMLKSRESYVDKRQLMLSEIRKKRILLVSGLVSVSG